ncbi:Arc family DNA-binding protein [Tropicimonas aquimaris]|uniref:Arc family DNA-binding protein n=1 Tax=Tropicimonas aquimaris TaxID=914152 RepID=A0ABW3IUD5_9RHOB
MANSKMGRGAPQFALRLPEELREKIKAAAERNGRSMNSEILERLEATFLETREDAHKQVYQLRLQDLETLKDVFERLEQLEQKVGEHD